MKLTKEAKKSIGLDRLNLTSENQHERAEMALWWAVKAVELADEGFHEQAKDAAKVFAERIEWLIRN